MDDVPDTVAGAVTAYPPLPMSTETSAHFPVMVLGGHRSGSSVFMSLLESAGLHLGTLIPPASDNTKGFFENLAFVEQNKRLLNDAGRDWTCPPELMDHRLLDLDRLRSAIADMTSYDGPWGLKDPRSLFTLPAWAPVLGRIRLVGIHRDSESIARSLARRNPFDIDEARAIALAYAERLAAAHRALGFPLVSFGMPPDEFLDRVGTIADRLGLRWDPERAREIYSTDLVHHRQESGASSEVDEYLERAAREPVGDVGAMSPATIVAIWESFTAGRAEGLPVDLGPHQQWLRNRLVDAGLRLDPRVGSMLVVERDGPEVTVPRRPVDRIDLDTFLRGPSSEDPQYSHIVAARLLDRVSPADVPAIVGAARAWLAPDGVFVTDGWITEGDQAPPSLRFEQASTTASRTRMPHLHHIDDITGRLLDSPTAVVGVTRLDSGRSILVFGSESASHGRRIGAQRLREAVDRLENDVAARDSQLASLRTQHAEVVTERRDLAARLEASLRSEAAARERLEEATKTLAQLPVVTRRAERAELDLARAKADAAKLSKRVAQLGKERSQLERRYKRLANRRVVRLGLFAAARLRPVFRAIRALRRVGRGASTAPAALPAASTPVRPPKRTRSDVVRAMSASRPAGQFPSEGPKVSIIILTRNGADHLETLLPRLEEVLYSNFEVIIVDNASSDRTSELLSRSWRYRLQVIRNEHNASFSDGNNQGVASSEGDYLLFLNNDLDPIGDDWLAAMVAAAKAAPTPAAVGALLVYPERGLDDDLTVQHRGLRYEIRDGELRASNLSHGDPTDPALARVMPAPGATAAALLVPRDHFFSVNGFTTGYVYGTEDVDLCLKLRQLGPIVVQGQAAFFHNESATQRSEVTDIIRINRTGNWRRFAEAWGPTLNRSIRRDRIRGSGSWTGAATRTVAITLTADDESKGWGDYYTAHQLGDAFAAAGWRVVYAERFQDKWYELDDDVDLLISLLDSFDVRRAPKGAFTIAWVRNWVERWMQHEWFEHFDLVVASSHKAAEAIRDESRYDPPVLPLAADPRVFHPGPVHPTFRADIAFTGNNWGAGRKIIPLLDIHPDEQFLLFGKNWDQDPRMARYWRGHLPHGLLAELYRSTKVVLDDTAEPTLPYAFLNGRVFEALAGGALVLTDNVEGSDEFFGGLLPSYRDRFELRRQLDRFLGDDTAREELATSLRAVVRAHHTYDHRAVEFPELAIQALERPRVAIKIGVPRPEEAHQWGDFHFAHSLGRALSKFGMDYKVHLLPEWDDPGLQDSDITIHIRGLSTYSPKPSQVNVLWIISHPEDVAPEECRKYDLVLAASVTTTARLREQGIDAIYLPQATDANRFGRAARDESLATDVLFVGNSRGQQRDSLEWAAASGLPLTVYGSGWEGKYEVADEYFPNERLGALYASAGVVLNDHWPEMRQEGLISNRVFDVLASGGVVVSDHVPGIDELFDGAVVTFSSQEELEGAVRDLLADDEARRARAAKGREIVLNRHTFEHRARELTELIWTCLDGRSADCDGGVFTVPTKG